MELNTIKMVAFDIDFWINLELNQKNGSFFNTILFLRYEGVIFGSLDAMKIYDQLFLCIYAIVR